MSTTTITRPDEHEIFDHELDAPSTAPDMPRINGDEHDRLLEQLVAESREQRMRDRRREAEATRIHRRRTRGAIATGTVAIVIAVGGTLFFLEGPSNGTGPQSSGGTPAAAVQPASSGSQANPATPTTPAVAPVTPASGTTTGPASNVTPATPTPGPSGNNTGNMGSNGGPVNGAVPQ